jgi:hypothetical protein
MRVKDAFRESLRSSGNRNRNQNEEVNNFRLLMPFVFHLAA